MRRPYRVRGPPRARAFRASSIYERVQRPPGQPLDRETALFGTIEEARASRGSERRGRRPTARSEPPVPDPPDSGPEILSRARWDGFGPPQSLSWNTGSTRPRSRGTTDHLLPISAASRLSAQLRSHPGRPAPSPITSGHRISHGPSATVTGSSGFHRPAESVPSSHGSSHPTLRISLCRETGAPPVTGGGREVDGFRPTEMR